MTPNQQQTPSGLHEATCYASSCGRVTLYLGDCMDIMPTLGKVDALISDPPYGMDWSFTGQGSGKGAQGGRESVTKGQRIKGDSVDFDPTHLLGFDRVVIWGMHHFPQHLKRGTVLVWPKKYADAYGSFLSDADTAWMKGGCGVYLSNVINPASFQAEKCHPTQKPVQLMAWCMDKAKVPEGATVLDPYMGSGSTIIAAIRTGRRAIGIELDPAHYANAVERVRREIEGDLFHSQHNSNSENTKK
jgi:site-specific DNA-methyltransferase (adenine-specific)